MMRNFHQGQIGHAEELRLGARQRHEDRLA
jgi:hypothetical protein